MLKKYCFKGIYIDFDFPIHNLIKLLLYSRKAPFYRVYQTILHMCYLTLTHKIKKRTLNRGILKIKHVTHYLIILFSGKTSFSLFLGQNVPIFFGFQSICRWSGNELNAELMKCKSRRNIPKIRDSQKFPDRPF